MRRLPVYFVLDCSESMAGSNHQQMQYGIQEILASLRKDPHALETVYVSVIAFAGIVRTLVPLVELYAYYPVRLPLGGGTSLGKALEHLMNEMDRHLIKSTPDVKGDWKPMVYLFTDGRPTDECKNMIYRWQKHYSRRCTLVAIGLGKGVDFEVLKQLTPNCLAFEELNDDNFKKFFKWLSSSILTHSQSLGAGKTEQAGVPFSSDNFSEHYLNLMKDQAKPKEQVDDQCVTLVGRCANTARPYLMKFERETAYQAPVDLGLNLKYDRFALSLCCPIDDDYFTWTDVNHAVQEINTNLLKGAPECPCCGAETAFAMCGCGNLMCYDGETEYVVCPWCRRQVSFGQGGDEGFDVKRGRG
ncbi:MULTISPECIES: TerY-C metal binding domain-containing protein [unclassified Acinetobacter]|uniref:TerY-C metal binding domain-containing protein n=1 Tax=unclassified Acinetobacter TaxID=196816 RepID=UPI0035B75221